MSGRPRLLQGVLQATSISSWRKTCQSSLPFLTSITKYRSATSLAEQRDTFRRSEQAQAQARAMEKNQTRDWKTGDVYAPHDLSAAEARKWRKRHSPKTDAFDALSLNPLDLYKNFSIMSEYMTEMGRIRHSNSTGLRPVNQRRIAKAIRRAIALGLMPSIHRHPEVLKRQREEDTTRGGGPR